MGWPMVALGEVLTHVPDPVPVSPEQSYPNLGLYSYARGAFQKSPIDGMQTSARTLYKVRSGQFIYSRLFAFEGAYTVVPEEMDGFFVSNEYPTFDHDRDRLCERYLSWMFTQSGVWRSIAARSKGMGDRRQRVHPDQVLGFHIPLPPLDEQRRIAARLDRVAALVEGRCRAALAAEREMRALLLAEFARAIDGAPRRAMREVAPLIRRPVEIDLDQTYPELGVRSFGRGAFHKPALSGTDVGSKKLFEIRARDLLFNIVFAWEGAVAVAGPEDDRRVGSHRFLTCVPDPREASVDFLRFHFLTDEGLAQLGEASPGGAGRNRTLGLKKLETIEVPVPAIERQRAFDGLQARAREIAENRARAETHLDALLPALLHEEFAGCT